MKKKDIFLVLIIIFVIIVLFVANNIINEKESESIEIYVDNKIYKTIQVNGKEELEIDIGDKYNNVKIHDGGVEMTDASCPDKVCVNTGFISEASQRIVCMPNKVVIKIKTLDNVNNKEDIISE